MELPNLKRTRSKQQLCTEEESTSTKDDKQSQKSRSCYTLDFAESFKTITGGQVLNDCEGDELVLHEIPQQSLQAKKELLRDNNEIDFEYKRRAVEYWRSCKTKKRKKFSCVQKKFRRLSSEDQLKRWEKYIYKGGTHHDKISQISEITIKYFMEAVNKGLPVKNEDICRWALLAREVVGIAPDTFSASDKWIKNFKKRYGIIKRKKTIVINRKKEESSIKDVKS